MLRRHSRPLDAMAALVAGIAVTSVAQVKQLPLAQQPFPDASEYADSAERLAHHQGFITLIHGPLAQAPRYPPGLPFVLSLFARFGSFPTNIEHGGTVLAVLYVLVMIGAAWSLGGSLAALVAGLVVLFSPFARENAQYVMSDGLVATLLVLVLPILHFRRTVEGERLGGALMGFTALVRLTGAVGLLAMLCAWPRQSIKRLLAWAVPFLVGLGLLQWAIYGNPLYNGYDYWGVGFSETFSVSNVFGSGTSREGPFLFPDRLHGHIFNWLCPCGISNSMGKMANFFFYPVILGGGFWVFAPPLFTLIGVWWVWRHRSEPVARYVAALTIGSVMVFDFYKFQAGRFVAGPASALVVVASVAVAEWGYRLAAADDPSRAWSRYASRLLRRSRNARSSCSSDAGSDASTSPA